jgi:hypothetical protein
MAQYNEATKILKEKEQLEDRLYQLRQSMDFMYSNEYAEICNRLFELGQNFSAL